MPWGKYRWLRMPFGLKVSGDVFQERLDKVLRLVPGVLGIADDIVIHGPTENTHNGTVLVLCETARLNNLSLNSKKMQFKSTDCKFFGHRLTPDGIKVNPKKIEAIIQMDPPQNVANLQSFNGMINYLKKFSPVLSELSETFLLKIKEKTEFYLLHVSHDSPETRSCLATMFQSRICLWF